MIDPHAVSPSLRTASLRSSRTSRLWNVLLLAGCLLSGGLLSGCDLDRLTGGKSTTRSAGSAAWMNADSVRPEPSEVARLESMGVAEFFLEAARLDPRSASRPLEPLDLSQVPEGSPATLVVLCETAPTGSETEALGTAVGEAARSLRLDAESRGILAVGLHVDCREARDLEAYGTFLEAVGDTLDDDFALSVSLARGWEEREGVEDLVDSVDSVVAFFYGQRLDEPEANDAWDFLALETRLEGLEALDVPYHLGIVTLGHSQWVAKGGGVRERTTFLRLQDVLWNRAFEPSPGFTLEGSDRRLYVLDASRDVKLGPWDVAKGDSIRLMRVASADLEGLFRLLEARDLPNRLGEVYWRIPADREALAMSVSSLADAIDTSQPATPDLELQMSLQRRTGRGWLVRFGIENHNGEFTELSLLDNNFLQVNIDGGTFNGGNVDTGDFYRFELFRKERNGELKKTFRRTDVIRLFLPIVESDQRLSSGDIEVLVRGEPTLEMRAEFLLPDGRTLEVGPARWRGGEPVGDGHRSPRAEDSETPPDDGAS